MLQIRSGVFETNSSSTHTLSIATRTQDIPDEIHLHFDEYGIESGLYSLKNYLYTAILNHDEFVKEYPEDHRNEPLYLPKLKNFFDKYNVAYYMEEPYVTAWGYVNMGYLDDDGDYFDNPLLERMFDNDDEIEAEDTMMKCFFGNSYVDVEVDR